MIRVIRDYTEYAKVQKPLRNAKLNESKREVVCLCTHQHPAGYGVEHYYSEASVCFGDGLVYWRLSDQNKPGWVAGTVMASELV
jgi:hypothetical protein